MHNLTLNLNLSKPLGKGFIAPNALTDKNLLEQLSNYKNKVASNYRSLTAEKISEIYLPAYASIKIDGEMWFLLVTSNQTMFINPKGKVIGGDLEIIDFAKNIVKPTENQIIVFCGELHCRAKSNQARTRHGDTASLLGSGASANTSDLQFAIFDILELNNTDSNTQSNTTTILDKIQISFSTDTNNPIFCIPTKKIQNHAELELLFNTEIGQNRHEGLVVKSDKGTSYKIKPIHSIDVTVIGYSYSAYETDKVRSLLVGLIDNQGNVRLLGSCGNPGNDNERIKLMNLLKPLNIESMVRVTSPGGSLFTFVQPKIVVEIAAHDIQALKSDGSEIKNLNLICEDNIWKSKGFENTPTLINPMYERIREDKSSNFNESSLDQISDFIIPNSSSSYQAAKSNIINRKVWVKETKGVKAVRKLVVWKTNKENANLTNQFPAYALCWTDFSAGRAKPLDKTVKTAPSLDEINAIAESLIAENIKKGWNLVE